MSSPFKIIARLHSFKHAFSGIHTLLESQPNARLHLLATGAVCALGFYSDLSRIEWCLILLAIMAVWITEALNTSLEFLADVAHPEFHPLIKKSKDVAAAAVLISALAAAILGGLVFVPRIMAA